MWREAAVMPAVMPALSGRRVGKSHPICGVNCPSSQKSAGGLQRAGFWAGLREVRNNRSMARGQTHQTLGEKHGPTTGHMNLSDWFW